MMFIMVASIIGTIVVAILSVLTLTQGYGFKHTIDPPVNTKEEIDSTEREE